MRAKTKTFDCVEMKNRIQAERMAEYAEKKSEYVTFADFVNARTAKSEWVRQMRKKLSLNP